MNKPNYPDLKLESQSPPSFLTDKQIKYAISQGQLVRGDVDLASAKYACFEVHIGERIQQMIVDEPAKSENDLYRVKSIPDDGQFAIKPGETFKLYASETLDLPANAFAIAIPVGNMYKLGLNPETTFADPGFSNDFYITVCNYSRRVVKLRRGDPLARIFFFYLSSRPDRIHESNPREVPPAVVRMSRRAPDELIAAGDESLLEFVMTDVDPPHYEHVFVTKRLLTTHATETGKRLKVIEVRSAATFVMAFAVSALLVACGTFYLSYKLYAAFPNFATNIFAAATFLVGGLIAGVIFSPIRSFLREAIATLLKRPE